MAPVEFENQIKERFEKRRIDPSADSWNRISGQLEPPAPVKRSGFFPYGIAAAVVGILLAVTWMFNSSENTVFESETVVEKPGVEDFELDPGLETPTDLEVAPVIITDNEVNPREGGQQTDLDEEVVVQSGKISHPENRQQVLKPISIEESLIIESKITEIVAQVSILESGNNAVTDAEVDSLLKNAQTELLADKNFRQGYEIDANILLADVEDELDQSFRDQVFDKLKQGFIKVRTAVADRNK